MLDRFMGMVLLLGAGTPAVADDLPPFPTHVPPILGTAVVTDSGNGNELSEWRIGLTLPMIRWEIVGEMVPKREWPKLNAEVEKSRRILRLGGPSQLAESRIVDVKGKELTRDQVLKRLARESPVLVSVSGRMPDAFYLQLTNADALIVILGSRDGYPAPELLPAEKGSAQNAQKESEK